MFKYFALELKALSSESGIFGLHQTASHGTVKRLWKEGKKIV